MTWARKRNGNPPDGITRVNIYKPYNPESIVIIEKGANMDTRPPISYPLFQTGIIMSSQCRKSTWMIRIQVATFNRTTRPMMILSVAQTIPDFNMKINYMKPLHML